MDKDRDVVLDPDQVAQLRVFGEAELREIVTEVVTSIAQLIEQSSAAILGDDFTGAAEAAHRGRNEALVIGARDLGKVFEALESAAHDEDRDRVLEGVRQLRAQWPAACAAIERLVAGGP
jgi:HPt (histidine-containing phosphotransfer) domain-containing protein